MFFFDYKITKKVCFDGRETETKKHKEKNEWANQEKEYK